jgi:MFS family permease
MKIPLLLREKVFRRYWTASTVSLLGEQVSAIAVPLTAVLVLHASAAEMGYLTALAWLPSLLFGVHLGAWVDRSGRRRQLMIAADVGRAILWASIPVTYALHVLTLPLLYAIMFAGGTLSILFFVADSALFTAVVKEDQYVVGQALMNGSRGLTGVVGPSLGGLLVELASAPAAIIADAVSVLGSAFFLSRIRPAELSATDPENDSVTAGARYIARDPIVRALLYTVTPLNFCFFIFEAIYLLYAVRDLHLRPFELGLALGASAVGGVLGSSVTSRIAARIGIGRAYGLGCLISAVSLLLWPAAHGPMPLVVGLVLVSEFGVGFGVLLLDTSSGSIWAAVVPDDLKGHVTGAFQAVNLGVRPVGALLGGLLGTAIGLRPALLIGAVGALLSFLLVLPSPLPRYKMPDAKPELCTKTEVSAADTALGSAADVAGQPPA